MVSASPVSKGSFNIDKRFAASRHGLIFTEDDYATLRGTELLYRLMVAFSIAMTVKKHPLKVYRDVPKKSKSIIISSSIEVNM